MKKKITIIFCLLIIVSMIANLLIQKQKDDSAELIQQRKQEQILEQEAKKKEDLTPPVLKLKEKKITVTQGISINYEAFIAEAKDDVDGNLTKKVHHDEIDTAQIGTHTITYTVADQAGNVAKEQMVVQVKPDIGM